MTADTGACDTVMLKVRYEGILIYPSAQSERGMLYEVANKQIIRNFGERRVEVWTEGAHKSRSMAIQVADVHKPLLSLSRSADMGFESRFGKYYGCLVDTQTGEMTPLHRQGQLYMLRAWVRGANVNPDPPFGGPR